jgi:hypothetical protein
MMWVPKLGANQDGGTRLVELFGDPKGLSSEAMTEQYGYGRVSLANEPKRPNRICECPFGKRGGCDPFLCRGLTDAAVVDAYEAYTPFRKPIADMAENALWDADPRQCKNRGVRSARGFIDPTAEWMPVDCGDSYGVRRSLARVGDWGAECLFRHALSLVSAAPFSMKHR